MPKQDSVGHALKATACLTSGSALVAGASYAAVNHEDQFLAVLVGFAVSTLLGGIWFALFLGFSTNWGRR